MPATVRSLRSAGPAPVTPKSKSKGSGANPPKKKPKASKTDEGPDAFITQGDLTTRLDDLKDDLKRALLGALNDKKRGSDGSEEAAALAGVSEEVKCYSNLHQRARRRPSSNPPCSTSSNRTRCSTYENMAASKRPAGALSPTDVALFPTSPCTAECCLKEASHTPGALPSGGCPGNPICGLSARSAAPC